MAVRGMPSSAYGHFIPRNPADEVNDHSFKVIYNQFFNGPVEQKLEGCSPELQFQYDKADKTKIMVTFSRCAPGDGTAIFSFPLGKLQSISYSEKAIVLHFNEHSAAAKHLYKILNVNQDIESKAPESTESVKSGPLIFFVDQTKPSIVKGSSTAYLKDLEIFSGWVVPPLKKNKCPSNTDIGSRFIEHLDDVKWTEFLQALYLEVDPNDQSRIAYKFGDSRQFEVSGSRSGNTSPKLNSSNDQCKLGEENDDHMFVVSPVTESSSHHEVLYHYSNPDSLTDYSCT